MAIVTTLKEPTKRKSAMKVDDISFFSRKSPKVARLNFTGQKGLAHRRVLSSVGVTFCEQDFPPDVETTLPRPTAMLPR